MSPSCICNERGDWLAHTNAKKREKERERQMENRDNGRAKECVIKALWHKRRKEKRRMNGKKRGRWVDE